MIILHWMIILHFTLGYTVLGSKSYFLKAESGVYFHHSHGALAASEGRIEVLGMVYNDFCSVYFESTMVQVPVFSCLDRHRVRLKMRTHMFRAN